MLGVPLSAPLVTVVSSPRESADCSRGTATTEETEDGSDRAVLTKGAPESSTAMTSAMPSCATVPTSSCEPSLSDPGVPTGGIGSAISSYTQGLPGIKYPAVQVPTISVVVVYIQATPTIEITEVEERFPTIYVEDEVPSRTHVVAQPSDPTPGAAIASPPGVAARPSGSAAGPALPAYNSLAEPPIHPAPTAIATAPVIESPAPAAAAVSVEVHRSILAPAPVFFAAAGVDSVRPPMPASESAAAAQGMLAAPDSGVLADARSSSSNTVPAHGATSGEGVDSMHAPCVAGLLTPTPVLTTSPVVALEELVAHVESTGRTLAQQLQAVVTSPWLGSAVLVVATSELARRRLCKEAQELAAAIEVPGVTGPSELT
jgi:hypothetical protein